MVLPSTEFGVDRPLHGLYQAVPQLMEEKEVFAGLGYGRAKIGETLRKG